MATTKCGSLSQGIYFGHSRLHVNKVWPISHLYYLRKLYQLLHSFYKILWRNNLSTVVIFSIYLWELQIFWLIFFIFQKGVNFIHGLSIVFKCLNDSLFHSWVNAAPVAQQCSGTVQHVRQCCLCQPPPREARDGVGQGRRQVEEDVRHQYLLQQL